MRGEASREELSVRDTAARWFSVQRCGDMTAQETAAFSAWLTSEPDAQYHLDKLQQRWAILGSVADDPAILAIREHDLRAFNRPGQKRALMAAAAGIILAVTSAFTLLQTGALDRYWNSGHGETFQTGTGQRSTATLADGSIVTLDAESELRVVEMTPHRRLQLVHGHAFFQVAHDPLHPFLVEAAGKTVRAIGTKFDVRLDSNASLSVTLVEGRISVVQPKGWLEPDKQTDMVAGSKLVAHADQTWKLTRVDAVTETSWLKGRLTFVREPLANAVDEVNRYSSRKIVFADGAIPDTDIVGVFAAGDVDGFVTAMELNGIARVVGRSDTEIELASR